MNKNTFGILFLGIIGASHAFATTTIDWQGGTIKNRATKEHLGLICLGRDSQKICQSFQFVRAGLNQTGELEIIAPIGNAISAPSQKTIDPKQIAKETAPNASVEVHDFVGGINNSNGIYGGLSHQSLTGALWDDGIGIGCYQCSFGGILWRAVLIYGILTPVTFAVDATVYSTAAVLDAVEIVGDAAWVSVHNSVNSTRQGHIKRKTRKAFAELYQPIARGKSITISAGLYEDILKKL